MTDDKIIASLISYPELPSINEVIVLFRCKGYQQAKRCLEMAKEQQGEKRELTLGEQKLTLEDF